MIVKLLSEYHLEFLSLKGGCRGSSESALIKMSNCWKSHAAAHYYYSNANILKNKRIKRYHIRGIGCPLLISINIDQETEKIKKKKK